MEKLTEEINRIKSLMGIIVEDGGNPKWVKNIIKLIQEKGATLQDLTQGNKSKKIPSMGIEKNILKYFPTLSDTYKIENLSEEIKSYIASHKRTIIPTINEELNEYKNTNIDTIRYQKNMGTTMGYFNLHIKIDLNYMKIEDFNVNTNEFSGEVSIGIKGSVPDGLFKGASRQINIRSNFSMSYSLNETGKTTILNLSPKNIVLNSSVVPIAGSWTFKIKNNDLLVDFGTIDLNPLWPGTTDVGDWNAGTLTPDRYVEEAYEGKIGFTIPNEKLKNIIFSRNIPTLLASLDNTLKSVEMDQPKGDATIAKQNTGLVNQKGDTTLTY